MISRDGDLIVFECDGVRCWQAFEAETYSFYDALARLKEASWSVVPVGSQWHHYCPSCEEDRRAEKAAKMAELAKKFGDL
jgi:hypothetical protein